MSKRLKMLLICTYFLSVSKAFCQNSTNNLSDTTAGVYSNLNAGFGLIYGGYGLSIELGKKHLAGFASFGYATQKQFDNFTLNPSFNVHGGLRYYFNVESEIMFPRAGLSVGWITNYHSDKIGNQAYNQSAYGLSAQIGAQFYATSGLVVNIDLAASSKVVILDPKSHPYFFDFYFRPCVGLGIDLQRLFKKEQTKSVQNKAITPFG